MSDVSALKFGLDTFGDLQENDEGKLLTAAQTIRNVVEEGVHADAVGLDHFNVGEHHRDDFAISAPDIVLAGIATRTKRIGLGTGVTVLSSDDPIRVYERFATLDALSHGRAEITAGRGSFIESFPLFGFDLNDYSVLFEEKLQILVEALKERPITWSGRTRTPLVNQDVFPKTEGGAIPLRVGVGGTPESVVRTARMDAQLALAIIGGDPARFAPFSHLYRHTVAELGGTVRDISIHSPGHISDTDEKAIEELWPSYEKYFGRIGRERGWPPVTKDKYMEEVNYGSLYVGSPETVAKKIAHALSSVQAQRFDLKYANGHISHSKLMNSIELYATKVVPRVRDLLS